MKTLYRVVAAATFSLFLLGTQKSHAQNVRVEFLLDYVSWEGYRGDKDYGIKIRLYRDVPYVDRAPYLLTNPCLEGLNKNTPSKAGEAYPGRTYSTTVDLGSPVFDLYFVSHEERKVGSNDCTSEGTDSFDERNGKVPDIFQIQSLKRIDLSKLNPGEYSNQFVFINEVGGSKVIGLVRVRYIPPAPTAPSLAVNPVAPKTYTGGLICGDLPVVLASTVGIPNTTGLKFIWQYHIANEYTSSYTDQDFYKCQYTCDIGCDACANAGTADCYLPCDRCYNNCQSNYDDAVLTDIWRDLGESNGLNPFTFTADALGITSATSVQFRVIAVSPGGARSNATQTGFYTFLPGGPKLPTEPVTTASCPNKNSGSVVVKDVVAVDRYRYFLRFGQSYGECVPDANTCFGGDKSGVGTEKDFTIDDVKAGRYTLWVTNSGGEYGVCYTLKDITIPEIPTLAIQNTVTGNTQVTCFGGSDAGLTVTSSGGAPAYTYSLVGTPTGGSTVQYTNATGVFTGLPAATYTASVRDVCQQDGEATKTTVQLTQPRQTLASPTFTPVRCNNPADGSIAVAVTGGEGTYTYSLSVDGSLRYNENNTTATTWGRVALPAGTYTVEVKDAARPACSGYSSTVVLEAPPTLGLLESNLLTDSVSCNNGADGRIRLTGVDVTGAYLYRVTAAATGLQQTATTSPTFSGLLGGDYAVAIQRNAVCNDVYTYPAAVRVLQPTSVTTTLDRVDITCYGNNDGILRASITGGTGSDYSKLWQYETQTAWADLGKTTATIAGLQAGNYRLNVTDKKNCAAVSATVAIIEPQPLTIDNVVVADLKCLGEKGTLTVAPAGGTAPYTFTYTTATTPATPFTSTTPLGEGTYTVSVTDANGCAATFAGAHTLTAPPSAVSFTGVLSDFNGFAISCFGGSNGAITVAAAGGNGAGYTGYGYAVDARPFQPEPRLENINAGTHLVRVQDGRGCVVEQPVVFTQTTARLVSRLIEKQDVNCLGDQTGIFEVAGSGGLLPFRYSLNGLPLQPTGRFTNLAVGDYTITLTDKNNCSADFIEGITTLNPPMQLQVAHTDVACFNGGDGTITVTVTGGVPPFQYRWPGVTAQANTVAGLPRGDYTVVVTDHAGCTRQAAAALGQPTKPLEIDLAVTPVCYGKPSGKVTVAATRGGTPPYRYSSNNGATDQANTLFLDLPVGSYTIQAKDANGCTTTGSAVVIQREDRPVPSFLAATKRNALDTLIIREVSRPAPDSVSWVFDSKAVVVGNDPWAPQVLVTVAGTYTITMTGYFAGCEYAVTETLYIDPFDPRGLQEKLPGYRPIESVTLTPNPSAGEFEVSVTLARKLNLSILVYDMIGATHYSNTWESVEKVKEKITLDNVAAGIYLVRIITESDARDERIIIK